MAERALIFSSAEEIGRVAAVDTHRVSITVENPALLTRIGVGNLVAISGPNELTYYITIVERVIRTLTQSISDLTDESSTELEFAPTDVIRATLVGTYRTVDGAKRNTFKRGTDSFPQIDRAAFAIESGNLQRFMGLLGQGYEETEKLILGKFVADHSAEAIASGDRLFQRHAAILGSTGSGKSYATSLILERASQLKHANLIVFDMHGEYGPLAGPGGFAKHFRIAGPSELLSPKDNSIFIPYWMLNNDEMLSLIVDRSDMNAPNQASRLRTHVRGLKEETLKGAGKFNIAETFTVDSPIPYKIDELLDLLKRDNTEMVEGARSQKQGDWYGRLTRLIGRLEAKLDDRRYGFLFQPPPSSLEYDWLGNFAWSLLSTETGSGVKIIDFSEVPSDVLPVVAGMIARFIYDLQFWTEPESRTPVTIVCDEAHLYLPVRDDADSVEKQALRAFERIAKEGRKYGLSILVVSQRPSDVSKTILSQCNNFIALRLNNDVDQSVIKRLVPDQMAGLIDVLPLLDIGEALVLGDAMLLPTRVKLDLPRVVPASATKDFWREWSSTERSAKATLDSVEFLRGQSRQ